jgi:hypothetical protein
VQTPDYKIFDTENTENTVNKQKNLLSNVRDFSIVRVNAPFLVRGVNCFHPMETHKNA